MTILFAKKPLVLNVGLAIRIGLNEAIILQQIHYWIEGDRAGVDHEGRKWIYNTHDEWQKQFPFWSTETIARALRSIREMGLVDVEQLKKHQHDRTNFYTINLSHRLLQDDAIDDHKMTSSVATKCSALTENTTENTTENNPISPGGDGSKKPKCPVKEIVGLYNDILAHQLPRVVLVNAGRQKAVTARWNEDPVCQDIEFWKEYFTEVSESDFLMGRTQSRPGQKPFEATFDWLVAPSNFVKVIEGNYANKTGSTY